MTTDTPTFLLASPEPALLNLLKSVLSPLSRQLEVALTAEAALAAMSARATLELALIDTNLPGMEIGPLLTRVRLVSGKCFPIVLIAETAAQEWIDRMAEGVIDDLVLRSEDPGYLRMRVGMALHTHRLGGEIDALRVKAAQNTQLDHLTGVYNREALLTLLSRETDRLQRTNGTLSLLLFDIDDFGHWNSRLGVDACDHLLCQVANRASRLLRSYDAIGRPGKDEFLLALPGCGTSSAVTLAERLRTEVFFEPFRVARESIRLSACFGIASSNERSPAVILREAEQALAWAKSAGPESIQCFGEEPEPDVSPVTFLSANSGEKLLAW